MSRISSFLLGMATGAMLLLRGHALSRRPGLGWRSIWSPSSRPGSRRRTSTSARSAWPIGPATRNLASALVQANQQQLLGDSAAAALQESVNQASCPPGRKQ